MYEPVDPMVELPKLEHEILDFWRRIRAFEKRRKLN